MEYHEIGERFEYDGVILEVIQTPGCVSCFFRDNRICKVNYPETKDFGASWAE